MVIAAAAVIIVLNCVASIGETSSAVYQDAQPASDVQSSFDYWLPVETRVTSLESDSMSSQNEDEWQLRQGQAPLPWQQAGPPNYQQNENWLPAERAPVPSPSSSGDVPIAYEQIQSTTPATWEQSPDSYVTTSAFYRPTSTDSHPTYRQSASDAANGCAEGSRRSVPSQSWSYVICDNGVWIPMTCAPGTVFSSVRNQCMVGLAAAAAATSDQGQKTPYQRVSQQSYSTSRQQTAGAATAPTSNRNQKMPYQASQVSSNQQTAASQSNTYVQSAASNQQRQQNPTAVYSVISSSPVQQISYASPSGTGSNYSLPSYSAQEEQQPQPQYVKPQQPQVHRFQSQGVRRHPATNGYANVQTQQEHQLPQQPQQQHKLQISNAQSAQQQAAQSQSYANFQPLTAPVSQQQTSGGKPSSWQPVSAGQQPLWQPPLGNSVPQGWQPAPAPLLQQWQQTRGGNRMLLQQSVSGQQMIYPTPASSSPSSSSSNAGEQGTQRQPAPYSQRATVSQTYSQQQPVAANKHLMPVSEGTQQNKQQSLWQQEQVYQQQNQQQQIHSYNANNPSQVKITVAV